MIIEAITIRNFGAYAGEQRLAPGWRTATGGAVTLIGGMNGYGKTSLLEAVLLALYGRRSPAMRERGQGRYTGYLKDLSHRGAPADAESGVALDLSLPGTDGPTRLRVSRTWQAGNTRKTERLTILRDGHEDAHLAEQWDTYVEELIPAGIAGLFFFDGERISELAESDETTDALRQAIRALLGLETVDRLIADLDRLMRRHRTQIKDERVRDEIGRLHIEVKEIEALIGLTHQQRAHLKNEIDRTTMNFQELELSHARAGGELVAGRARLEAQRDALRTTIVELRAEVGVLAASALPFLLVEQSLSRIATTVENEQTASRARIALPLLHDHNAALLAELRAQNAETALVRHLERFLDAKQSAVAQLAAHTATFPLSPAAIAQLKHLQSDTTPPLREAAAELTRRHAEAERELERIERYLQVEPDRSDITPDAVVLAELRARLASFEAQRATLGQELQTHEATKERIERRITEVGAQVSAVEEADRLVRFAARSQETMRTFRERVTRTKIAHLARQILDAFVRLTHKESLVADIRVDPDTLHITLVDAEGQETPKLRLSSGERQMLALAILWGLARASGRTLPVIIDTPMGRLDSSHRRTFVTEYLPNASHQVIVLSTDTEIIGGHLDSLNGHVGRRYYLAFDEAQRSTQIVEGYFAPAGVRS